MSAKQISVMSPEEIGRQILDAVKAYVSAHVDPLRVSIAQAHAQLMTMPQPVQGERGEKGEPGPAAQPPSEAQLLALITPLIPAPLKGEPGEKGEPGQQGPEGKPGKDAAPPSEDELRALIAPLIPAPVQGEAGPRGERGEKGAPPTADELRALIIPLIPAPVCGEKGADGKDGRDGRDGEDGAPGRDALALQILPAIDQERSYPRGTYAAHAGGLWRSFEATAGMRGWECIVEGIAQETETLSEDGRTLVRRTVYSSGREFSREFRFSTVLDRGVYKQEHTYVPGDAVTWAGSIWIAQKLEQNGVTAPSYGKPGTAGSGWRLAVKAGRDARS